MHIKCHINCNLVFAVNSSNKLFRGVSFISERLYHFDMNNTQIQALVVVPDNIICFTDIPPANLKFI